MRMENFNEDRIHTCPRATAVHEQCPHAFEETDSANCEQHCQVRLLQSGLDRRCEADHGRPRPRASRQGSRHRRGADLPAVAPKLAEKAGWDRELLAIELEGLIEIDVDIEVTGFEMAEIDLILEEACGPKRAKPAKSAKILAK